METALEIQNITFKYGKRTVLNDISFKTYTGEVFGLLGPNGAGKTTLIKLITGLLNIEEGKIELLGKSLENEYEEAMSNLGAIVENPEMYGYMTGRQNIMQYVRMRKGITKERIDEVVELVGLTNRIDEKVCRYSLGMRQRLGVALALLHNPKILILDEPTNGLDPAGIKHLRDILIDIAHKQNVCVIVSSHLMSEMQMLCDRIAIIKQGTLIKLDTLDNLLLMASNNIIKYSFNVSDTINALNTIKEMYTDLDCTIENDNCVSVSVPTEQANQIVSGIIKSLVAKNIDIYSVVPQDTKNLEETFIELTSEGGYQIA
ncbi:MAG: ABC transporter ATP-binding protein [Lachnospiraceae bacterium]|nr:ABC transporter ATP-binding protein [Lachnospiraceae bacterium]